MSSPKLDPPLSKEELKRQISAFFADKDRGISIRNFSIICGVSEDILYDVFTHRKAPLTEYIQTRVNRGYAEWKAGMVSTMYSRQKGYYVDYRKQPKSPMMPSIKLGVENGQIRLKVGMKNRHDYSDVPLKDQFKD